MFLKSHFYIFTTVLCILTNILSNNKYVLKSMLYFVFILFGNNIILYIKFKWFGVEWRGKRQQNMNKLNVSNKFNLMSLQGCCLPYYHTCTIQIILFVTFPDVFLKLEKEIHIKQDIFL